MEISYLLLSMDLNVDKVLSQSCTFHKKFLYLNNNDVLVRESSHLFQSLPNVYDIRTVIRKELIVTLPFKLFCLVG